MPPDPVCNWFLNYTPTRALNECREEPVHAGKVWEVTKGARTDHLEAAASIGGIIAQREATYSVRNA